MVEQEALVLSYMRTNCKGMNNAWVKCKEQHNS